MPEGRTQEALDVVSICVNAKLNHGEKAETLLP